MRIVHVKIKNVLGVTELDVDAGKINVISGGNGVGKTSILEGIKATLKGGNDATLLSRGATEGEVVLVFDDGTTVQRKMKPNKTETVVTRDGLPIAKPMSVLDTLRDLTSVNPIEFLTMDDKERIATLSRLASADLDDETLRELVGNKDAKVGADPFTTLKQWRDAIFNQRTGINREAKSKSETANGLDIGDPNTPTSDHAKARIEVIERNIESLESEKTDALGSLGDNARKQQLAIKEKQQADIKAVTEKYSAEIKRLQELEREEIGKINGKASDEIDVLNNEYNTQRLLMDNEKSIEIETLKEERAKLVTTVTTSAVYDANRETKAKLEAEATKLKEESEALTERITNIDGKVVELLSKIPVEGLEVIEGTVFLEGVPFDRVNTQKKIDAVVALAGALAGKMKLVCVDGIEALDKDHYDAFIQRAQESDLQYFVTKVNPEAENAELQFTMVAEPQQ